MIDFQLTRVFYGYECDSPIVSEVYTMAPERVYRHGEFPDRRRRIDPATFPPAPPTLKEDLRYLLDYMETEYVGPEVGRVLRRLRSTVGA